MITCDEVSALWCQIRTEFEIYFEMWNIQKTQTGALNACMGHRKRMARTLGRNHAIEKCIRSSFTNKKTKVVCVDFESWYLITLREKLSHDNFGKTQTPWQFPPPPWQLPGGWQFPAREEDMMKIMTIKLTTGTALSSLYQLSTINPIPPVTTKLYLLPPPQPSVKQHGH